MKTQLDISGLKTKAGSVLMIIKMHPMHPDHSTSTFAMTRADSDKEVGESSYMEKSISYVFEMKS